MTIIRITLPDTVFDVDSIGFQELSPSLKQKIISKKTLVTPGKLLTMDNVEANDFGFSSMTANSIDEMLTAMNIKNYTIVPIEQTWSEVFVRFIGSIAPILMIIGFACIYWEIKTPGLIFPAVIGIICLAFVFAGQYMVGLADYTELLLIMLGVILLGLEMFVIPGMGIAGISGIFFIAIGILLSLQDFVLPKPDMPWQKEILEKNLISVIGSMIGGVVVIALFFIYIFPKLGHVVSGPYLTADLKQSHVNADMPIHVSVGDEGIVEKPLRPSGIIQVRNGKYDAVADGEFFEKGEAVIITEIRGNIIVVSRKRTV
jgi:membrane-bound serine protease (ClpP class)